MRVDGDAQSSRILELREILSAETNVVREARLVALKRRYPSKDLWVHDSVCAYQFSEGISRRRLLSRFHISRRKIDVCRARFNPDAPPRCKLRYRFGCTNTVARDQIFRKRYRQSTAQRMGMLSYIAFWETSALLTTPM